MTSFSDYLSHIKNILSIEVILELARRTRIWRKTRNPIEFRCKEGSFSNFSSSFSQTISEE